MTAKAYYNEAGDFTIQAPYNERLVQRIRKIPIRHRSYNPDTKSWLILKSYAQAAEESLIDVFPDAEINMLTRGKKTREAPLPKAKVSAGRAFAMCIQPVLERDNRTCRYCGSPAAHIDQFKDGDPDMDNLVACCLSCRVVGKDVFFDSIEEKSVWITSHHTGD